MRLNDAVVGVVLLLFAAVMMAYTTTFPAMPGQNYGPALFPVLIGIGLSACGVLLVLSGLRQRRTVPLVTFGDWIRSARQRTNLLLVPTALIFYILVAEDLGFVPTAFLILIVLTVRFGTPLLPAVAVSAAATLVVHMLFAKLLLVPLPWGLLEPFAW